MRQWTVDAFASGPFRGNPASVVEPFDAWPDDAWMQAMAAENNHAETSALQKTILESNSAQDKEVNAIKEMVAALMN